MQGYDIQGNGLRIGQLRGGVGPFSRLQSAGAFGGLIAGMLVIALLNITGWSIVLWTLLPTVLGGVVGTHVLGVSLVGHVWHAARFVCTGGSTAAWTGDAPAPSTPTTPIVGTLMDGERLVWQVAMPASGREQR